MGSGVGGFFTASEWCCASDPLLEGFSISEIDWAVEEGAPPVALMFYSGATGLDAWLHDGTLVGAYSIIEVGVTRINLTGVSLTLTLPGTLAASGASLYIKLEQVGAEVEAGRAVLTAPMSRVEAATRA